MEGNDEAGEYDGNGGAELDEDVEGGAGGILERIANGVANNSSLVLVAAQKPVASTSPTNRACLSVTLSGILSSP